MSSRPFILRQPPAVTDSVLDSGTNGVIVVADTNPDLPLPLAPFGGAMPFPPALEGLARASPLPLPPGHPASTINRPQGQMQLVPRGGDEWRSSSAGHPADHWWSTSDDWQWGPNGFHGHHGYDNYGGYDNKGGWKGGGKGGGNDGYDMP